MSNKLLMLEECNCTETIVTNMLQELLNSFSGNCAEIQDKLRQKIKDMKYKIVLKKNKLEEKLAESNSFIYSLEQKSEK